MSDELPEVPDTPAPAAEAAPAPSEYRYPDDATVPDFLRGKSVHEAAKLMQELIEGGAVRSPQPPPPTPQAQPDIARLADSIAQTNLAAARREHADVFRRYEPEIAATLRGVPRDQWTPDVISNAVALVSGRHLNEIAAARARQLDAAMEYGGTMRSSGHGSALPPRAGAPQSNQPSQLDRWRQHAASVGITQHHLVEFCRANDMTEDEFFNQFRDGVITDAAVSDMGPGKRTR